MATSKDPSSGSHPPNVQSSAAIFTNSSRWKDLVGGFLSGIVSISATYPLHKLMFRQMRDGVSVTVALDQVRKEGFSMLYRGVLPPLAMRASSMAIMFYSYGSSRDWLHSIHPNFNPHVALVCGAAIAGISEAAFAVPFERIQTLLLDKKFNTRFHNTIHVVRHIWKHHQVKEFYRGSVCIMFRNSVANTFFFLVREKADKVMPIHGTTTFTKLIVDFINGGLIGAFNSTIYYPVNVVKTRMQSRLGGPFESPKDVLLKIYNERGGKLREMYRGVHMNYTRSMLSWGITNACFGLIKKYLDHIPTRER